MERMIRFFKIIDGEYITYIGTGSGGTEITEEEYNEILSAIHNKPPRTATTDYRLKTDLSWEEYEHEPDPEPDPTPEEALSILLGGAEL